MTPEHETAGISNDNNDFNVRFRALLADRPDMAVTLGVEPVSGNAEQVVLRMPWRPEIAQPTGVFSAAALFGLADFAGTFLALQHARGTGFPLAVTSTVHLLGNISDGAAEATALLMKAGRTVIRTDTMVRSLTGAPLASVQTTYLNPAPR
jgi:uncharacterized protein (TIGR00369 family)